MARVIHTSGYHLDLSVEQPFAGLQLEDLATQQIGPVSLSVAGGECVTLSGPSGSGKTRLLRAVADLDGHGGAVYLDGRECNLWDAPTWRRNVALLPVANQWWHDTVGEHFGAVETAQLEALGFSRAVLEHRIERLSSGERQRLALLRVLVNRPRVLLLDEPTASLDGDNAARVEALVERYRRDAAAAVVWVGHDPAQVRRVAQRHFTLAGGVVREEAA